MKAHSYTVIALKTDFEKFDKDKDGKWSLEEFLAFITESCTWYSNISIHVHTYYIRYTKLTQHFDDH